MAATQIIATGMKTTNMVNKNWSASKSGRLSAGTNTRKINAPPSQITVNAIAAASIPVIVSRLGRS